MPQSLNTLLPDPDFTQSILTETVLEKNIHNVATNSFGFGGNNCCLLFSDQKVSEQSC